MNTIRNGLAGIALLLATAPAAAEYNWHQIPQTEVAKLPPFCHARMRSELDSADYKYWESVLGKDLVHTHHYCASLHYLKRYYSERNAGKRVLWLRLARDNLIYMTKNAAPEYSLMPDIYYQLGETERLDGKSALAIDYYQKALQLNPRYPKAFAMLADLAAKGGQRQKALELVTRGLQENPDSTALQRRYREFGGKLPYPSPSPAALAEQAAEAAPAAAAGDPGAETEAAPDPRAVEPQPPKPVIGVPGNPYCRFCP